MHIMVNASVKTALVKRPYQSRRIQMAKTLFRGSLRSQSERSWITLTTWWPKPGSEKPVEKFPMLQALSLWGWIHRFRNLLRWCGFSISNKKPLRGTVSSIIILISLLISFLIVRSILLPLVKLQTALPNISAGDGDLKTRLPEQAKINDRRLIYFTILL